MTPQPPDLVRTTLGVIFIGALIIASLWILRPFLASAIWATMIVVATWPEMRWLESRFRGRRWLAVTLMVLLLMLLFMVPLLIAVSTIYGHTDEIRSYSKEFATIQIPAPPDWLAKLPFIGEKLQELWEESRTGGPKAMLAELTPYADNIAKWAVAQAGSLGTVLIQFLLTVILSAVLYMGAESAAQAALRFGQRLAGRQGETSVILAGQSIRAVALGVGVTAVIQSALGGVGLAIAGVPFAGLLSAVMLLMCIAQLGPGLVMFPAVAWLYWTGSHSWGTFLLIWSLVVVTMDNFVRPALIKRGADLPLLLIFAGVIGGLLAFGLLGIFVGPVLLAVSYTLLDAWVGDGNAPVPLEEKIPAKLGGD